jgi:hypothetical protein
MIPLLMTVVMSPTRRRLDAEWQPGALRKRTRARRVRALSALQEARCQVGLRPAETRRTEDWAPVV